LFTYEVALAPIKRCYVDFHKGLSEINDRHKSNPHNIRLLSVVLVTAAAVRVLGPRQCHSVVSLHGRQLDGR